MKVAITTNYTYVSPYKEKWEEQQNTWVPWARKLKIPVYTTIANCNIEGNYLQVGDFIHWKGKMKWEGKYHKDISYNVNSILQWAKDQDLDYILMVDNDVFVEPNRFLNLLHYYKKHPEIICAGHCIPYLGWDPQVCPVGFVPSPHEGKLIYPSGGAGIILSKKGISTMAKFFLEELEHTPLENQYAGDYIMGKVLEKHNIPLYQEGRLFIEFPGKPPILGHPTNYSIPYIGDPSSFLVTQHEADGNMHQIMKDLNLE